MDYNSRDGMVTYVWGPAMWHFLHTVSFNYPPEPDDATKRAYWDWLHGLQSVLPCGACRDNLRDNLRDPQCRLTWDVMRDRETLSRWMVALHNRINRMLGKPPMRYQEVRERYEQFRARCVSDGHGGCTRPADGGEPARCQISIVPRSQPGPTFTMDQKCARK